ncbi:MAG: hypothetical protein IIA33_07755 [Planctomycetes bacterium]|nr:hypothetical protein [Planctomycetota bacterium]
MVDILPSSAIPPDVMLSAELDSAREQARTMFRTLPPSDERNSVLGALGRLGKNSLKQAAG